MDTEVRKELDRIGRDIDLAYDALEEAGAEMPQNRNTQNLASTIQTIDGMSDGKDKPTTLGQVACLARAAQMRDIKFTPLKNLISDDESHVMSANNEYEGIWYSSTRGTEWGFIGFAVSMYSLLTALHNPKSIIYTRAYSDYFLNDASMNGAGNVYGTNCSSYVSYALGLPYLTVTNWLPKLECFVNENGVHDTGYGGVCWDAETESVDIDALQTELKLCDVLNSSGSFKASSYTGTTVGHAVFVTGIRRDRDGRVQEVDISESTSWVDNGKYGIRQTTYTWADFASYFIESNGYRVYRFADLDSVGTPPDISNIVYSDICTSRGDKISIRPDQDLTLNVLNVGSYTGVALFRNNDLLTTQEISASAPDWKLSDLESGKYIAILYDGNTDPSTLTINNANKTNSTSFIVCDCTVSRNGTTYTFTAEPINGEYPVPVQVTVKKDTGITVHVHELNYDWFGGEDSVIFAMGGSATNAAAIVHVPFKTEYGFVIAEIGYDGNPVLPDDTDEPVKPEYQNVEYVQFTGTQYINTGVEAKEYNGIELDYYYKGMFDVVPSATGYLFGVMADGCRMGNGMTMGGSKIGMYLGSSSTSYRITAIPSVGKLFELECKNVCPSSPANARVYLNSEEVPFGAGSNYVAGNITTTGKYIHLLAADINGTVKGMFKGKLYGFSISKSDGTPIRNFVPCYRTADGEIGLYDTVEGEFYANAGTGKFTKGSDVT